MTHLSKFLSYGQKMDPSNELNRFLSADRGFGKSQFFLKRSNKSIYEPISKRIVDSERPRDQRDIAPFRYWYFEIS